MKVEQVDGNALAGILREFLAGDPTTMETVCGGCGARALLADSDVERDGFAAIVRCRGCTHTLFTVLTEDTGIRLVFGSVHSLQT